MKLREAIAQKLGVDPGQAEFADGYVRAGNPSFTLADVAEEADLWAEDAIQYGDLDKRYQQSTFDAHFVEVAVDAATGKIRVRRMLAVCAAGSILNPKPAPTPVFRAMPMGAGAALREDDAI